MFVIFYLLAFYDILIKTPLQKSKCICTNIIIIISNNNYNGCSFNLKRAVRFCVDLQLCVCAYSLPCIVEFLFIQVRVRFDSLFFNLKLNKQKRENGHFFVF